MTGMEIRVCTMAGKKSKDHKEVISSTPAEPDIEFSGHKEVPGDAPITTPEPLNLLPYAIVIGAVIGVGSVVLRKKGAN